MYSLTIQFSRRPFLPPPFTPIVLAAACGCKCNSYITDTIRYLTESTDHPDVGAEHTTSSVRKFSNVYRNPSVRFYHLVAYANFNQQPTNIGSLLQKLFSEQFLDKVSRALLEIPC